MIKVSVIIPIYNSSKYLKECLNSVISQTLKEIEIICINDGSTDNSLEIINEFQKKDSRIKVINQKNGGVSAARNAGLRLAAGKYVGFVDGDDDVEPEYYKLLVKEAESTEADAVYSVAIQSLSATYKVGLHSKEDIINKILPTYFSGNTFNAVWSKLYKSDIIRKYDLQFPVGIKLGEDAYFNIVFLMKANLISIINISGYNYRIVQGSATNNIQAHDYLGRIVEVYEMDWSSIIGSSIMFEDLKKLKKIRFVNAIISLVFVYADRGNNLSEKQRITMIRKITSNETVKKVFNQKDAITNMVLSKFSKVVFRNISRQNVIYLYLLTQYSYFRNK